MQVLEDHEERLPLALAEQEMLDSVERALPALDGIECQPGSVLDGHVKEGEQGRHGDPDRRGDRQDLPRDLLPDLPRVVAAVDLEVAAEQLDHEKVGGGLTVGDRTGLQD